VRDVLEQILTSVADGDLKLDDLLAVLGDIDAARKLLKDARADVDAATVDLMPFRRIVTAPSGVWSVGKRSTTTKWNHREAGFAVVDRQLELDPGALGHPRDVIDLVLRFARIDYWLTTELDAVGLKPDDYRTRTGGALTVTKA
jgi:hypothetical protein